MPSSSTMPKNFTTDRVNFFSVKKKHRTDVHQYIKNENHNYEFIALNKTAIEQEYNNLFSALNKRKKLFEKNQEFKDEFWLYWYYCSVLLQFYYKVYDQGEKAQEIRSVRREVFNRLKGKASNQPEKIPSLLAYLAGKVYDFLVDLGQTPAHLSKIKTKVAYANLWRIYWFFSRTTVIKAFILANEYQVFDTLANFLGRPIDLDKIINALEIPTGLLKLFSVGFFLNRLVLNSVQIFRHTFMPYAGEEKLSRYQRFKKELILLHADIINDLVWSFINLITNFAEFFHITAVAAGWIVAGFMVFDIALILWRRQLAFWEYDEKKQSYLDQLDNLDLLLADATDIEEKNRYHAQTMMLRAQLEELEIAWNTKSATFYFNALAATILVLGFSASMLVALPVLIILCYAVCTLAISMYLSDESFATFQHKSLLYQQAKDKKFSPEEQSKAYEEYKAAALDFGLTLLKNLIIPAIFITTFAICWEAALVLTAVYIGYLILDAYFKKQKMAELEVPNQLVVEGHLEAMNDEGQPLEEAQNTQNYISPSI